MWTNLELHIAMEGVRVLLQVIFALNVATAQIAMRVDYPAVENRNQVKLTCTSGLNLLRGAQFLKDGVPLTEGSASHQVSTLTSEADGEVTFTFTQAQEGLFRCSAKDQTSPEIGLAGA